MPLLHDSVNDVFGLSVSCVHLSVRLLVCLSGQILLPWYLMNSLSNFNKTDR